jgi:hypothetical protein
MGLRRSGQIAKPTQKVCWTSAGVMPPLPQPPTYVIFREDGKPVR